MVGTQQAFDLVQFNHGEIISIERFYPLNKIEFLRWIGFWMNSLKILLINQNTLVMSKASLEMYLEQWTESSLHKILSKLAQWKK